MENTLAQNSILPASPSLTYDPRRTSVGSAGGGAVAVYIDQDSQISASDVSVAVGERGRADSSSTTERNSVDEDSNMRWEKQPTPERAPTVFPAAEPSDKFIHNRVDSFTSQPTTADNVSVIDSDDEVDDDDDDDQEGKGWGTSFPHLMGLGSILLILFFITFFTRARTVELGMIPLPLWTAFGLALLASWCLALVIVPTFLWILERAIPTGDVLYYITIMRVHLLLFIHAGFSLMSWYILLGECEEIAGTECNEKMTNGGSASWVIARLLWLALLASIVFFAKVVAVQRIANGFHQGAHMNRIRKALLAEWAINTLLAKPRKAHRLSARQAAHQAGEQAAKHEHKGQIDEDTGLPIDPGTLDSSTARSMLNYARRRKYTSLSTQLERSPQRIKNREEALVVAELLFRNVYCKGRPFHRGRPIPIPARGVLTRIDFEGFFKSRTNLEIAWKLFDVYDEGRLSFYRIRKRVLECYRNRINLAKTIKHADTSVAKLSTTGNFFASFFVVLMALLVFDAGFERTVVGISTVVVLLGFFVGSTAKVALSSAFFLFVYHPFDCGDRVLIDGENLVVERMDIMTTVFVRWDGLVVTIPNSELQNKTIYNYRRSRMLWGTWEIEISYWTTTEQIGSLISDLNAFVHRDQRNWSGEVDYGITNVQNSNMMRLNIWALQRHNHQDLSIKWALRNAMFEKIQASMLRHGINFRPLTQTVAFENANELPFGKRDKLD